MAVIGLTETTPSGSGRHHYPEGASYTRTFDVLTNTYADNATVAGGASFGGLTIPAKYTVFAKGNDTDAGSVVIDIDARREKKKPLLWHVTVGYLPMRPEAQFEVLEEGEAPEQVPATISDITDQLSRVRIWWVPFNKLMERDVEGTLIANTAGQAFKPVFEETDYRFAVEISRFERNYYPMWFEQFKNKVNEVAIWGVAEKTLLMIGAPGGTRHFDEIGTYYDIRFQMHYNPKGWDLERVNKGMYKRYVPPGASISEEGLIRCTDATGAPVTEDVLLDETGYIQLGPDDPPVILDFVIKESIDFEELNLPKLNLTW